MGSSGTRIIPLCPTRTSKSPNVWARVTSRHVRQARTVTWFVCLVLCLEQKCIIWNWSENALNETSQFSTGSWEQNRSVESETIPRRRISRQFNICANIITIECCGRNPGNWNFRTLDYKGDVRIGCWFGRRGERWSAISNFCLRWDNRRVTFLFQESGGGLQTSPNWHASTWKLFFQLNPSQSMKPETCPNSSTVTSLRLDRRATRRKRLEAQDPPRMTPFDLSRWIRASGGWCSSREHCARASRSYASSVIPK